MENKNELALKLAAVIYKHLTGKDLNEELKKNEALREDLNKVLEDERVLSAKMKHRFVLTWANNQFWEKGLLREYENGKVINRWRINCFYSFDGQNFLIYDTAGGQGTGYRKGEILHRINIGNAQFKKVEVEEVDNDR